MADSKMKQDQANMDNAGKSKEPQKIELNDLETTKDPKGGRGRGGDSSQEHNS